MKKIISRIFYLSSLSLAFVIPLPDKIIPAFLSLCLLFMLLFVATSGFKLQGNKNRNLYLLIFVMFSAWSIVTLLYSENIQRGIGLFERRIVLLILPLYLLLTANQKHKRQLLQSFILGNFLIIILITGTFLISYFSETNSSLFSNKSPLFKETLIKFKHPSFLSMNFSLSMLAIGYLVKGSRSRKAYIWLTVSSLVGFLVIYLSYARMGFIVYTLTVFYVHFILFFKRNRKLSFIVVSFILVGISLVAISNNTRFTSILHASEVGQLENTDNIGYTHRISIWTKSIELIRRRPLFGYGLGDSVDMINWSENGNRYIAHNQFLEFLIEGGFISLLLFFIPVVWIAFKNSYREHRWFSIGALGIFLMVMLTESILNRIAGISSFALFLWIMNSEEPADKQINISGSFSWLAYTVLTGLIISLCIVRYSMIFNPANPKTYSDKISRIIDYGDLPGNIPEALPVNTKGYLLDRQANASFWDGNAYAYTSFHKFLASGNEILEASVFCFVSENFNGEWVRISAEGPEINNKASFYDLTKKGTWQFLKISPESVSGNTSFVLFVSKYDCSSFERLEGYVIFAYPQYCISNNAAEGKGVN